MQFFIPILGFTVMLLMLKYRRYIYNFTGDFAWAEKYLGPGGTMIFLVLFSIGVFIISLMYGLGTIQGIIGATFGKIF